MVKQRHRKRRPVLLGAAGALLFASIVAIVYLNRNPRLTALEERCVGSWEFIHPDAPATLVVYHFDGSRRVREEHFYLTSATPAVPRITFVGQWRVGSDGRMIVEAGGGLSGIWAGVTGKVGEFLDDDQRLARPVLRRTFPIDEATSQGLAVRASRSGGKGEAPLTMKPFGGAAMIPKVAPP